MLDYNEEARKLFATLDGTKPSRFNNLDPIYRSDAGGFIYVGGDLVTQHRFLNSDIYTQYSEKEGASHLASQGGDNLLLVRIN